MLLIILMSRTKNTSAQPPGGYSQDRIRDWSFLLRRVANDLHTTRDAHLADHYYDVHYAIGPEDGIDQFDLDEEYLKLSRGGRMGLVESIRVVLASGGQFVEATTWEGGLREYLEKLLTDLTA